MTFNIYHGEKNYVPGKSSLKQIAEVINEYKPDFVAMQEVDSLTQRTAALNQGIPQDLIKELATLTGMYGHFGKAIDYSGGGYGEGILSRYPARSKVYNLPIPKGGEGRALLTVSYTLPGGQKLVFAGTHLCHEYAENRQAQAEAIVAIFKDIKSPVIMGGDFNFTPGTAPYKVIEKQFSDAAAVKGNPQFTIPYHNPSERIDYIFLSRNQRWLVKDVKAIRNDASDHMPVLVRLKLE